MIHSSSPWEMIFDKVALFPLFLFNFSTELLMEAALSSCELGDINTPWDRYLSAPEYVVDIVLLNEEPNKLLIFLDYLNDSVGMFGMRVAFLRCKLVLEDWIGWKVNLVFSDGLNYLSSCNSLGCSSMPDAIQSVIQRTRLALETGWSRNRWVGTVLRFPNQHSSLNMFCSCPQKSCLVVG